MTRPHAIKQSLHRYLTHLLPAYPRSLLIADHVRQEVLEEQALDKAVEYRPRRPWRYAPPRRRDRRRTRSGIGRRCGGDVLARARRCQLTGRKRKRDR